MKHDDIKALSDSDLAQVIGWAGQERDAREARRKQETLARIRQLAQSVGVAITIAPARSAGHKAAARKEGEHDR